MKDLTFFVVNRLSVHVFVLYLDWNFQLNNTKSDMMQAGHSVEFNINYFSLDFT